MSTHSSPLSLFRVAAFGLCVGLLVALSFFLLLRNKPLLSPISSVENFHFLTPEQEAAQHASQSAKIVYGFLPYWNIPRTTLQPELTHLAYFSLDIAADGTIVTEKNGRPTVGYAHWTSESFEDLLQQHQKRGGTSELVLTQTDNEAIRTFLSSPAAQQNFFKSLDALLLSSPIDGINIDIEYSSEVTPQLRQSMSEFMKKLNEHLQRKHSSTKLSIDVYSNASEGKYIWDLAAIEPSVDYFIVMAYDFHRSSSSTAGPVAPLFGGNDRWSQDIMQHIRAYTKVVPKQKILLGVPFYGYEWRTTSRESQAHTFPRTGSTASIIRVQEILAQKENLQVEEHWNELALSPYLSYQKGDNFYVVYYENPRSLSYKLDLINQLDLGGVAIWSLGYEGNNRQLWDVIKQKL